MKTFNKDFINKVEIIQRIIKEKFDISTSNNICLLIHELIRLNEEEGIYQIQIVDGLNFVASKYFDITENNWKFDNLIASINDAFEICKNIKDLKI